MATVIMFQSFQLNASTADTGRLISFVQDWVGVGIRVDAVTGAGAQALFKLQWSNDNVTWTDDPAAIATVTAPGTYVSGKRAILGLYWRLSATVTGTTPVITCSAGAAY